MIFNDPHRGQGTPHRRSLRADLTRITLILLGAVAAGCVSDIDLPFAGDCAEYPDGVYDYGDIGIGRCLAAPTDLEFYEHDGQTVLYAVNANAYLNFSTGSILPIPWDDLEATLDGIRADAAKTGEDEAPVPVTLMISDVVPPDASPYYLPNFSGKMVIDPDRQMAFVSNRLSSTTNLVADDVVYGIDLLDPLNLLPYDLVGGRADDAGAPVPDGNDELVVQHDPFGMALAPRDRCNGLLYVVNETTHNVSVIDTNTFPIRPIDGDRVGLVTPPAFTDAGPESLVEIAEMGVTSGVLSDRWTVTASEGTYRAWYRGEGLGDGGSVGFADSGDGLEFVPNATSPVLSPGASSLAWDADGIGRVSVVRYGSAGEGYLLLYEGRRWDDTLGRYRKRIGLALATNGLATSIEKYDVGEDGDPANDFVLEPGRDFDATATGAPWTVGVGATLVMWYTGEDEAGTRTLGRAVSYDQGLSWEDIEPVTFETSNGDPVSAEVVGTEQLDATGFWDSGSERFRLWFVAQDGNRSWLVYAESLDGASFVPGNLEGTAEGRLTVPGDAILRSPSVDRDGLVLRLWYVSSTAEDADSWALHYARGFDGIIWYPVDLPTALGGSQTWEGGPPSPTILKMTTGDDLRLEGEAQGLAAVQLSLQSTALVLPSSNDGGGYALKFTALQGHVLGAGPQGAYRSDTDTFDDPAWDAFNTGAPSVDWETPTLYYAGQASSGETRLGAATPRDEDGLAWTNAADPLPIEPDSNGDVGDPDFVRYEGMDYLYYTDRPANGPATLRAVQRAETEDTWSPAVAWYFPDLPDGSGASAPSVLPPAGDDDPWHLWFTIEAADGHQIGHATSPDGLSWTLDPEPALTPGTGGDWDDDHVEAPSVLRLDDGRYGMWYAGYDGTHYRIGLAVSEPGEAETGAEGWTWTRTTDTGLDQGLVLQGETGWWDAGGVTNPEVTYDAQTGLYHLWYEGILGSLHRVGRAASRDGVHWWRIYAPLSAGDTFTFETRVMLSTEQGVETPSGVNDGAISLEVSMPGNYSFSGIGATEISLSPDCRMAAVGARYVQALYILDVRDDSTDTMFDANYNGIEAMPLLQTNAYDVGQANRVGARSSLFSPSGDRLYLTTADPDAVVVLDPEAVQDASVPRVLGSGVVLGTISLERGSVEDKGASTSGDVGPIGLAITSDGRYLWVANANANDVYTIDLSLGAVGQVVQVAHDVGELPVAVALSPDERYLVVANYLGDVEPRGDREKASHATLGVIDADPASPTFGRLLARIKNRTLED